MINNKISKDKLALFLFFTITFLVTILGFIINYRRNFYGKEAIGEILKVKGHGTRHSIYYKFIFRGEEYSNTDILPYSGCSEGQCVGYECVIIFDPENPDDSRIKEIIFD